MTATNEEVEWALAQVRGKPKGPRPPQAEPARAPAPRGQSMPLWGWIVLVLFGLSIASGHGPSLTACDMSLTEPLGR